jgi:hypothetical protein
MPSSYRLFFAYLWIAPHVLLVALLVAMLAKGMVRRFPFFFSYCLFELIQFAPLYVVSRRWSLSSLEYRITFLVGFAVSIALRFAIINEVFQILLKPNEGLKRLGKDVFRFATVLLLGLGVLLATLHAGPNRFLETFALLDRTVSFLQCGLLVVILVFSRYFAILWHRAAFGIALGFGLDQAVELAIAALHFHVDKKVLWPNLVGMGAYHCTTAIWLLFFLLPERRSGATLMSASEQNLVAWNRELRDVGRPSGTSESRRRRVL